MSVRSALGAQLERARIYSTSSDGKPIPWTRGPNTIHIKATRAAGAPPLDIDEQQEISRALERLTAEEREILRLQEEEGEWQEHRELIGAGDLAKHLRRGHVLIPGSEYTQHREGLPPIQCVQVYWRQWAGLTHVEIAERMGLTPRQVHSRIAAAWRKLRSR